MHWPSVLILSLIIAVVLSIMVRGIIRKKQGKSSCSCGGACGACPMGENCHKK